MGTLVQIHWGKVLGQVADCKPKFENGLPQRHSCVEGGDAERCYLEPVPDPALNHKMCPSRIEAEALCNQRAGYKTEAIEPLKVNHPGYEGVTMVARDFRGSTVAKATFKWRCKVQDTE